jgi:hypothetical protein
MGYIDTNNLLLLERYGLDAIGIPVLKHLPSYHGINGLQNMAVAVFSQLSV